MSTTLIIVLSNLSMENTIILEVPKDLKGFILSRSLETIKL